MALVTRESNGWNSNSLSSFQGLTKAMASNPKISINLVDDSDKYC